MSLVRSVGLVVAFAAGLLLSQTAMMWAVAPVLAGFVLVAVLVTELGRPRPERQRGSGAVLEVRRIRDYVPRLAAMGGLGLGLLLLAEMWLLTRFREADYFGLPGGWLDDVLNWTVPFAGWANSGHVVGGITGTVVVTLAVLGLGALTVWSTVRSPRAGTDEVTRERDERWRRGVVETAVGTAGWILATLVGLWNVTLYMANGFIEGTDINTAIVSTVAALLAALGFAGATGYATVLVRAPGR